MGNWAAAFKGLGQGMDDLRDAKEKTLELEYRNMRDNNLRRYQVEDRDIADTREDAQRLEDREWKNEDTTTAQENVDDIAGVSGTPRGDKYAEKDRQKQDDWLERIEKTNEGRSLYGSARTMTKEKFVDRGMELVRKQYDENADPAIVGSGEIPPDVYSYYLEKFTNEWEERQAVFGGTEYDGPELADPVPGLRANITGAEDDG